MSFQVLLGLMTSYSREALEQEYNLAPAYDPNAFDKQQRPAVFRFQSRKRVRRTRAAWARFLFLLAVATLLVSCLRAARLRPVTLWNGRRLAGGSGGDKDDLEESAVLDGCLDLQEEAGSLQRAPSPIAPRELEIPRILAALLGYGQESPSHQNVSPKPSSSGERTTRSPSPQPGPSHEYPERKKDISYPEKKSRKAPGKRRREEEASEDPAPKKHTSGWKKGAATQSPQGPSSPLAPELETFADEAQEEELFAAAQFLLGSPAVESTATAASPGFPGSSSSGRSAASLLATAEESLPGPSEAASAAAPPFNDPSDTAGPAIPGAEPGPAPSGPPQTHPYYRLPAVVPRNITAKFDPGFAFSAVNLEAHAFKDLSRLRELFAQPELTEGNVEDLIAHCEVVAGRLLRDLQATGDLGNPGEAVTQLGLIYLYMDALLCAVRLIGPAMNADAWWPKVASKIPPQPVFDIRRRGKPVAARAALVTQLSAALQSLKSGIRPGEEETVAIKRELFCGEYRVSHFKHTRWDPWRDDDKNSGSSGPAVQ